VGARFLRKLLGRSPSLPAEVHEALGELERLAEERPTLAGAAHLLADALTGLYDETVSGTTLALTGEQVRTKWAGGVPLLRGETLAIDVPAFARRWVHVCNAVQRHQEGTTAPALADALKRGALDPRQLVDELLAGRPEAIHARADGLGLDAGLTATVLRLTLFPVLSSVNSALASVRADGLWERGHCPTCGSWPLLGEFRGLEQARFLRCGCCAADWPFPRLRCLFCGNSDHRQLGYFHVENEENKYRAGTCESCRGYVKNISTLSAFSPPRLLVADLATMHLDLLAAERGFSVP
jgi:FdhE protein